MESVKIITTNKKAYYDYFIDETYEAGIVLAGSEVKSIRLGHVNLKDSYCIIREGEMWLVNTHITPYEKGSYFNKEATRTRKLLLKRHEIDRLRGKVEQKGLTLVPTKLYFKQGLVKIEVGLARGKELHDKRASEAAKTAKREADRAIKEYNRR